MPRKSDKSPRVPLVTTLGAAAGAALATYHLDPQQGRRRRALTRDQIYGLSRKSDYPPRALRAIS